MDKGRRKFVILGGVGVGTGLFSMIASHARWSPVSTLEKPVVREASVVQGDPLAEEALSRQYTADRFGGDITEALNNAPLGANVDFASGGTYEPLVVTGERNLYGRGIYAPVKLAAGPPERDLLTIRPPADGQQRAGMTLRDTLYVADSGRDAIRIDLSGEGRRMTRLLLDNIHAIAGTGYALNIVNELSEKDAISTSYVRGGSYTGGINIQGGGDSLKIDAAQISGRHGIDIALNYRGEGGGGADASQLVLTGINCTGATGIAILSGTRTRIEYCNLELPEGAPGSGDALLYLKGPGVPGGTIENATIFGNYLAPIQKGKSALRLSQTNGTQVVNNTITCGTDGYGIVIDPESSNTFIGPNLWEVPAGREVMDHGRGTMGIFKFPVLMDGRSPATSRTPPRFIKRPTANGGVVELFGSITGGEAAANNVLFVLPEGFRPATYEVLTMRLFTKDSNGMADMVIAPTGEVMFDQATVSGQLLELRLSGQFAAPLV